MKLVVRSSGSKPADHRQTRFDGWSEELWAQADEQYKAWERIYNNLTGNIRMLGTREMVWYSEEEREQLDTLVQNMRQFAPLIGGDCGKKIARLHSATQNALREYDDFFKKELWAGSIIEERSEILS